MIRVAFSAEATEHEIRAGVLASDEIDVVVDVDLERGTVHWISIELLRVARDGFLANAIQLTGEERAAAEERLEDEAFRLAALDAAAARKSGNFSIVKANERRISARQRRLGRA